MGLSGPLIVIMQDILQVQHQTANDPNRGLAGSELEIGLSRGTSADVGVWLWGGSKQTTKLLA